MDFSEKAAAVSGLAVVVAPQGRDAALAALAALLRPAPEGLRGFDALDQALADPEASRIVVMTAPAVVELAQMMADGLAPTAAMDRWSREAGALLADLRRNRRAVTLLDRTALHAPGPEFCAALGTRLGLRAVAPETGPGDLPEEPAPLFLALAQMLLASDSRARRLDAELDAMMIAERGNGLRDDPVAIADLAFGALARTRQAETDSAARIEMAQSERDLMAGQLVVMQGQIAQDLEARTALQAAFDQLRAEAEAAEAGHRAALDRLRAEAEAAEAGHRAALDRLRAEAEAAEAAQVARAEALTRDLLALGQSEEALQAELDAAHGTAAEARARLDEARRELAALALSSDSTIRTQAARIAKETEARAEAERREAEIRASTSWRITGPMRRLVRLVRRH